ncbi:MAG TPA: pyridoxal 5'-phosphate synthase glutaminase subunit PdxT [bacterium]
MRIGILGLQGAVAPHRAKLQAMGHEGAIVRNALELSSCRGLIIPGGESTTMLKLIHDFQLKPALMEFAQQHPVWGVCAGSILIAQEVENPSQESFGWLPIAVRRNAYGRQTESFIDDLDLTIPQHPAAKQEGVFIRAPMITRIADDATVLARHKGQVVAVAHGRHMATTFHPELSTPDALHRFFLTLCDAKAARQSA